MASFRSRLQIPRMLSSKKPPQYGSGNCGNPPSPKIVEPCRGCPSKCLETGYGKPVKKKKFFGCPRQPREIKEKPSNCVAPEPPVEVKLSWWEQIFGPDPKRSFPDPCTCRIAHHHKAKLRAQDPRLDDPRYEETAGDVFLFTENVRPNRIACKEPQPKAPPGYKMPKAAMYKLMNEDFIRTLSTDNMMVCSDSECLPIKTYRIPYEEMRPREIKRRAFTCREGVLSQHVLRPYRIEMRPTRTPSIAQQYELTKNVKCTEEVKKRNATNLSLDNPKQCGIQKRSRIEQLKSVLQERDIFQCISSPY